MNRRDFLKTTGGAAGATAAVATTAVGPAAAQDGGQPDFGGYLDDVGNFDGSVTDATGQEEATVAVGAQGNGGSFAFEPAAIHVDNGATVVWEWTGEGGQHNVVHEDGDFESELTDEAGFTFEQTFEEDGIYLYYCQPHQDLGMKGAIVVGTDYPTAGGDGGDGGGEPADPEHMGVPFQPHFVGLSTVVMMVVTIIFTFYHLKYGTSPNAKGGNN